MLLARTWQDSTPNALLPGASIGEKIALSFLLLCTSLTIRGALAHSKARVALTEAYHLLLLGLLEILTVTVVSLPQGLILAVLLYIIYEIVGWSIFDVFVESRVPGLQGRRSQIRSFIWAVYTYTVTIWAYAIFYFRSGQIVDGAGSPLPGIPQALYFSTITIATVGFGDFHPLANASGVQILTALEPLVGIVILVLYFAVLVSGLSEHFPRSTDDRPEGT